MSRATRIDAGLIDCFISEKLSQKADTSRSRIMREMLGKGLTEKQRQYLLLRYANRLSVSEIALMYGVNRSTVSRTLCRARQRIAKALSTSALRDDLIKFVQRRNGGSL